MKNYTHKVKYYECDRMGVTHHSNYIRFMEECRIDALDKCGYGFEKMEADGIVSPVVSVNVNYRKTTTFQDEIEIELHVKEMTALKLVFSYKMKRGDELVCTAESTHCFIKDGRPIQLAEVYPDLVKVLKEKYM